MSTWPATLPQHPLVENYSETLAKTVLRTDMDAGPAKVRRRFTAAALPFKMSMILDDTDMATFDTFFTTTTAGGATAFDWVHPRTDASGSFRFIGQPTVSVVGPDLYKVEFEVELLP